MTVELRNSVVLVREQCVPCAGQGGRFAGLYESGWEPCGHCEGSGLAEPRPVPIDEFVAALRAYIKSSPGSPVPLPSGRAGGRLEAAPARPGEGHVPAKAA